MEEWRAIVGFEGFYEASNLGRVRSVTRVVSGRSKTGNAVVKTWTGRILRAHPAGKGYLAVCLSVEGSVVQKYVHQCVALAFMGPLPEGMEVAHGNGDKLCNEPWNLRYDTPKGNNDDKHAHGTDGKGIRNSQAVLNETAVREIRARAGRQAQRLTSVQFGVTQSCISDVQRRKTWAHVL